MMAIKIEKGIPVPPQTSGRKRIYPFHEMEVGDSFSVAVDADQNIEHRRKGIKACADRLKPTTGMEFMCRLVVEDGQKVIRCWRTK